MRGEYLLIVCLLLVAATSIGTEEFVDSQSFLVGEHNYSVVATSEGAVVLGLDGSRSIFYEDDCLFSSQRRACVVSADNESVSLEFFVLDRELDVSAEIDSPVSVGEDLTYTLLLENTGDLDLSLRVVTEGVSGMSDLDGYDSLGMWSGVVSAGRERSLSFSSRVLSLSDFVINSSVFGDVNASVSTDVSVVDPLSAVVEYEQRPSISVLYNFSVAVTDTDEELEVSVDIPDFLVVEDGGSFGSDLSVSAFTNESPFWFTYSASDLGSGYFGVSLGGEVDRFEEFSVASLPGLPLVLRASDAPARVVIDRPTRIAVEVFNPNNESISASYDVVSVLVDEEGELVVAAMNSSNISFVVAPNRTGEFSVRVRSWFVDENSQDVVSSLFVPFSARHQSLSESVRIVGPSTISSNESIDLSVDAGNMSVSVVWSIDGVFAGNGSVLSVARPGIYTAEVSARNQVFSKSHSVVLLADPVAPVVENVTNASSLNVSSSPVVEDPSSSQWYLWVFVGLVGVGGFVAVLRVRSTVLDSRRQEQLLEVLSMEVRTPEQMRLRNELLDELLEENKKGGV